MIRVPTPIPEPPTFDANCRQPGLIWLANNPAPADVTYDLWSPFRDVLASRFRNRCGYKAMLDLEGTVDHFFSRNTHRILSYEWTNFRFVSQGVNSSKQNLDDSVLDPLDVENDWFHVTLPDLQLRLNAKAPSGATRAKAEFTIKRLKLINGPNVLKSRRFWYDRHTNHGLPLTEVLEFAPLVGRAIELWLKTTGLPLPALPPLR